MKKLIIFLFCFTCFLINTSYSYNNNPKLFVQELVEDAISKLSDKSLSKEDKSKFIEKIALENVDINALGLYTLGELRKSSKKEEIARYQNAFKKYFIKSLTSRLLDYSSSRFEVISAEQKSSNYTIVKSLVSPENGGVKIKIDWRIYTKNPENPLIRDLIVEGLSLARTQKEEFASILNSNNNDLDFLIVKLEDFLRN